MAKITINDHELEVRDGSMIIEAADAAGIYIPRFCYHEKLSIAANCRMCLVEVEKAPKPLPACATPVADGMIVKTQSEVAVEAQKGTMEFLLINHPLDCPVCDQGGECPLQDQALGYGKDVSRFTEKKRVVDDKDIGPLIATEMTRCIHCTRCVRFGQEIGGVMEMGTIGRGEDMEIATFVGQSIDSEVSGNMIDLCPVGALTSKPYRFSARVWELRGHPGVSPHDCVGTNIEVQSVRGEVKRVLPRPNPGVNEYWLADRDRFAYDALGSDDRLLEPMVRDGGVWVAVSWQKALATAADGLRRTLARDGADSLAGLAAPTATLEEFYLLQQLLRGLGSDNVDHRLRQGDFSDDDIAPLQFGLGRSIASLSTLDSVLLIGSNIRKEQPLLGIRLREAALSGALVNSINSIDYGFHFPVHAARIVDPALMQSALADLAAAVAESVKQAIPDEIAALTTAPRDRDVIRMAQALIDGEQAAVIVGASAMAHPQGAAIRALAEWIAARTGATLGLMPEANAVAAAFAGCVPQRSTTAAVADAGKNVAAMSNGTIKSFLALNVEPNQDCVTGAALDRAFHDAEFNVALTAWRSSAESWANVMLPIATYPETEGTYVNCENRVQTVSAAAPCPGQSRPGWKVLRVIGNQLSLAGFDYLDCSQIVAASQRDNLLNMANEGQAAPVTPSLNDWRLDTATVVASDEALTVIHDVPLYRTDAMVRRCQPLQKTHDNIPPGAYVNSRTAHALGLGDGVHAQVECADGSTLGANRLRVYVDDRVSDGSVLIPGGWPETSIDANAVRLIPRSIGAAAG